MEDPDSWITKGKEPICDCTAIFEKIVKKCRDEKIRNIFNDTTLFTPYDKLHFDEANAFPALPIDTALMNLVGGPNDPSPNALKNMVASKYNAQMGKNSNPRTFGRNVLYPGMMYPNIPAPPIPNVVRKFGPKNFRFL